jgi:hypothetical protein
MARVDPSKMLVIQEVMKKEDALRYRWSLDSRAKVERYFEKQGRRLEPVKPDLSVNWIGAKVDLHRSASDPVFGSKKSSHLHFLEEKMGLSKQVYIEPSKPVNWDPNATMERLLYQGVSGNREGRAGYLTARSKLDPHRRFDGARSDNRFTTAKIAGMAPTELKEIGWMVVKQTKVPPRVQGRN